MRVVGVSYFDMLICAGEYGETINENGKSGGTLEPLKLKYKWCCGVMSSLLNLCSQSNKKTNPFFWNDLNHCHQSSPSSKLSLGLSSNKNLWKTVGQWTLEVNGNKVSSSTVPFSKANLPFANINCSLTVSPFETRKESSQKKKIFFNCAQNSQFRSHEFEIFEWTKS